MHAEEADVAVPSDRGRGAKDVIPFNDDKPLSKEILNSSSLNESPAASPLSSPHFATPLLPRRLLGTAHHEVIGGTNSDNLR
jgi:hypothetical protein